MFPATDSRLAAKRAEVRRALERRGQTSIEFAWSERNERLARGLMVWASLELWDETPLLGFYGIRDIGRTVVVTATRKGTNGT